MSLKSKIVKKVIKDYVTRGARKRPPPLVAAECSSKPADRL